MTEAVGADHNIRGRMVSGVFWRGAGQVGAQLVSLVTLAILARLILPAGFGLLGMAAILTELVARLADLGLGAALIQKSALDEEHMSSVFWTLVMLGGVSWGLLVLVSPIFAAFMHQPQLVAIIAVSGATFFLSPLGSTHRFLLTRDLEFSRLAVVDLAAAVIYGFVAVGLALTGSGVWSLVVGGLARAAAMVIVVWIVSGWRPRFTFRRDGIGDLVSFGLKAWAQGLLGYAHENGDYFVVGRVLGPTPLGYYTMAFTLANFPRSQLGGIISAVAFPGFSRIQHDAQRVGRGFRRIVRYTSLVSFPLLVGMIVLAREFILVVYGNRWLPSVLPLQLLAAAALAGSIISTMPSVLLAMGRPGLGLRLAIAENVVFFAFILLGVRWGISGVAGGLMIQATLFLFVFAYFVARTVDLTMRSLLAALAPAVAASMTMVAGISVARAGLLQLGSRPLVVLLACVLLGAIIYVGTLALLRVPEFAELRDIATEAIQARRARLAIAEHNESSA